MKLELYSATHRETVKLLSGKLRHENPNRPLFLTGAGASFTSGVPTATELVWLIGRHAFAEREKGSVNAFSNVTQTDGMNFLRKQGWFDRNQLAECFPLAVQHLLRPQSTRQQFFHQHTRYQVISPGYRALGRMFLRQLCRTILTTNFDPLLKDAFHEHKQQLHEIVEVNQMPGDMTRFDVHRRCQIVYLHGSIEHYTDRNLPEEVQQLNIPLAKRLWPMLADAPLIVVGYRGAEPSIVKHLLGGGIKESYGFKHGIYWCCRNPDEVHPQVRELAELIPQNFSLLKITGFDELICDLDAELSGETCYAEQKAAEVQQPSWDRSPVAGGEMDEIDEAALITTLTDYCENLQLGKMDRSRLDKMLIDRSLAVYVDGRLVPTNACLLLFGKDPQKRFPHALVTLLAERKRQSVFAGSLLRQLRDLRANLQSNEINPVLRVKNATGAEEIAAYSPRAVTELVANMLVHRNYEVLEFGTVHHEPGQSLAFANPGGLVPEVQQQIIIDANGNFQPKRNVSDCRNPVLADLFCGINQMDKQGSGLPDVQETMIKHGGRAEFRVLEDNTFLEVKLLQAEQPTASQLVATRRIQTEVYTTNLLSFKVLPSVIYQMPLFDASLRRPNFESDDERNNLPMCLVAGGSMLSFGDLRAVPHFAARHGAVGLVQEWELDDFLKEDVRRKHFVWLLGLHWNRHLAHFREDGLYLEYRRKRAFFHLLEGTANTIRYTSWLGRRVKRDVVKTRGEQGQEHENEGFFFRIEEMGGEWGIQVNPTYVFTDADGQTPLPPKFQTRRSTRRMKFDRNKMVGDDLMFWSRYLGGESEAINLGLGWDDDILIDMRFVFAELPVSKTLDEN